MNFHQQQQLAMAQQMAAQQRAGAGGGGGLTLEQQQQMAMANQMAAQYGGGMTPQQQQQLMMAQQMSAQYGGVPAGAQYGGAPAGVQYQQQPQYGQPVAGNPYAAPGYAPPAAPMGAPAAASDGTTVTISFPDGCLIGWDRLRNELILNGKTSNTRMKQIPARPQLSAGGALIPEEPPSEPVEKAGMMTKLGWKKNAFGADSWQSRYFRLTDTSLSYHKDPNSPPINVIPLNNGITVNVVNAATPARKNRYENQDSPGVGTMMTMNIGAMRSETSGPIGRENCVEMIVPGQIGTMIDGVMGQSAMGLAFGGGMKEMKKQGQGRTYYMSCDSRMAADEWAAAITNNIKALPKQAMPSAGEIGGANGYAGLNTAMNNLQSMKAGLNDMRDPSKSLQWYINSLGTRLPAEQVFALLDSFYTALDRNNVPHP